MFYAHFVLNRKTCNLLSKTIKKIKRFSLMLFWEPKHGKVCCRISLYCVRVSFVYNIHMVFPIVCIHLRRHSEFCAQWLTALLSQRMTEGLSQILWQHRYKDGWPLCTLLTNLNMVPSLLNLFLKKFQAFVFLLLCMLWVPFQILLEYMCLFSAY